MQEITDFSLTGMKIYANNFTTTNTRMKERKKEKERKSELLK
jgi:hypothetical protein